MLADLGGILERFVVGVNQELGGLEVATEAFDGPDDATGFEVEGDPGPFVVEGGAADEDDGADGTARLFLLEGCPEPVDAGVAVKAKRAEAVGDGVPVRVDQVRGVAASLRVWRTMSSISGVKTNLTPCLSRALMGRSQLDRITFLRNLR